MQEKLSRRRFLQGAALAGTGMLVAACAPKATPTPKVEAKPEEKVKPTAPPAKPAAEEVEVRYASWWGAYNTTALPIVLKDFKDEFPNVNVKLEEIAYNDAQTKYQTTLVAGTAPDILLHMNFMSLFYDQDLILVLDDYYARDGIDFENDFYHGLGVNDWGGKIYGFPLMFESCIMLYNKNMVKEYWGQDLWEAFPDGMWDTQDMIEVAKACTKDTDGDGSIDQWGLYIYHRSMYYGMETQGWTRGDSIYNINEMKYNLTSDTIKQMNHDLLNWVRRDGFVIGQEDYSEITKAAAVNMPFQAGRVGMRIRMSTDYGRCLTSNTKDKFDWDLMYLPNYGDHLAVTRAGGHGNNIVANSEHPDEAWEFVKFMGTSPGMVAMIKTGNGMPVYRKDPSLRELIPTDYPDHPEVLWGVLENRGGYGDHMRFHNASECENLFTNKLDVLYNEPYEEAIKKLDSAMAEVEEEMNGLVNYGDELPFPDIKFPFPPPKHVS